MVGKSAARAIAASAAVACAASLAACGRDRAPSKVAPASDDDDARLLSELRVLEARARAELRDAPRLPSNATMGADPYDVVASPWGPGFLGVLRGRDAIVALDADLRETARWKTVASPTSIALAGSDVWVAGELEPRVARYRRRGAGLERIADATLAGPASIRDLAAGPEGTAYAVDEARGRFVTFDAASGRVVDERRVCEAPIAIARTPRHLVVDCLLDHDVLVAKVGDDGVPRAFRVAAHHDGPMWAIAAAESGGGLIVLATGVEDAPLDRRPGFFGNVDSFLFAYAVNDDDPARDGAGQRFASIDLSDLGVVTPKALAVEERGAELRVTAFAYGSAARATFDIDVAARQVTARRIDPEVPGVRAIARQGGAVAAANPLVDAWDLLDASSAPVPAEGARAALAPSSGAPRDAATRVGEALFFTTLIAPGGTSDDAHSRFTCETCHFEGYVDGRTHFTGRGDVHATTKPLLGLRDNRPHFSRALDPDLSAVAHNEFRVASAGTGVDPWFSLSPRDAPWLAAIDGGRAWSPVELRDALIRFLLRFDHRESPIVRGRAAFTPLEREGAEAFAATCASCHAPRTAADAKESAAPFASWEAAIFAPAPALVWASSDYAQTGVVPYVHPRGARVPSLRRLYKKRPYFTNGTAASIDDVLQRARFTASEFWHDGGPAAASRLDARTRAALAAFLDLL